MFNFVVFVPTSHLEVVKAAMFDEGAGKLGNYDSCCFEVHGKGQFRPLLGSHAFLGNMGELEVVDEVRVELICPKSIIQNVVEAMKKAHPYETPAYYVTELLSY